jgi:hypothetical protein
MGTSYAQDEGGGPGVTERAKENFRAISTQIRGQTGLRSGLNFALGKPDKTR